MASGIFAILDDIAALMDDVAVAAKVASRKTAAILGDDLAVNAEKSTGFVSSRELPVLWAITKGSFLNKLIIVPIALVLNSFFPIAITYALVLGGFYLAYEGMEKIVEFFFHPKKAEVKPIDDENVDGLAAEKVKIRSAITTDFILSVEIVIIALGSVSGSRTVQILTVSVVAILATIGVYGLVALIVRMDDAGYKLMKTSGGKGVLFGLGKFLVAALPVLIKILAVVGTIALLLVSGGIFSHHIGVMHHVLPELYPTLRELLFGIVAGLITVIIVKMAIKIISTFKKKK